MPKGLNSFRQQTMREMMLLMNDMNRLTSSQGFRDSLNLGLTDQIMSANKAALTLGQTLQKSVNPLTGNLNLTAFNNELKRSSMTLTDYSKQLSQLGSVGQESFKSLTKAIISAETPLTTGSKLAQEMGVVIGNTMRWQAASSAIHGVLNTASQAVNYVRSLDSSLNDIRIVTGQSEEQMERFARQANQAAKELNTTTNQYAKASLIYYQQGLSDKQVAERTETTIKLANVSGQSAKKVSDQMTAIWNNFYDGGKSLEYYADVITALGATTASSSEEIAKGLSKFSSIAQTTGLSYEYATSALSTVVAATRQSADSVGTSFKTLFSRLQGLNLGQTLDDGTTLNKYSKALLTAGVNIKTTSGDLKDMDTILSELSEKWKALGDSEKVALAQTVGGARNYSTFMSLMENWDDFTNNLQTIQRAQGTLQKQADIYANSWAAASAHVRASAESIYSNLVDDKAFKGMINGFGSILDIAGKATDTMGGFGGMLTQVAAIATKAFGPQLSEGLSNLGYSAMNLLPGGMARVENLRQEAIDNLLNQSNLSSLERDYAKNFAQRNTTYLEGIKSGVISPANQAMLQSMMGHLDTLESSAIDANNMARASEQALNDSIRSTVQAANRINGNSILDTDMKALQHEIGELRTVQGNVEPGSQRYNMLERQITQKSNEYELLSNRRNDYYAAAGGRGYINENTHTLNYANYGQAIKAYGTAYFEQGQLNKLGDIFGGADGWKSDQIKETVSSLQRLITIGNGQGKSLTEMTTKGIYGEKADVIKESITAMEEKFKEMTANGNTPTEDQMRTFLGNYRDTLGLLSTGNIDVAGNLREELTNVFQHSGFKEDVARDMAAAAAAAEARARAQEEDATVRQSQTGLSKIFDNVKNDKTSIAQGLVRDTSSIAGVASSIVSISNAMKVFNDEAATSMDKLGAFAGAMMTMPMGITGGANLLKDVASLVPGTTIEGASPVAGTIALVAAAVAGGAALIHHRNEQIREAQYGTQLQNVTGSVSSYSQYTSAITELSDSFAAQDNNYLSNLNQLSQYAEGTREYQQALTTANQSALDLINNYGLGIDSYSISNGVVQLDSTAVEARKQQLEDLAQRATENGLIASAFTSALNLSDETYKTTQQAVLNRNISRSNQSQAELEEQGKIIGDKLFREGTYEDYDLAQVEGYRQAWEQSQNQLTIEAGTYTIADLAQLYKEWKTEFEKANEGQTFTFTDFENALRKGFSAQENTFNPENTNYQLIGINDYRNEEIAQGESAVTDLFGFLQSYLGEDNIKSKEALSSELLMIAQYTEDINLLKDRANTEVANLFSLAAGFEETDNVYSKLSAQILAKQTSFEDVNNLAGGTLPDTLKEISELTGNALYDRYIHDIDENATRAMLSQYSDEVLQSALSGEVMRDLADQILQKQNEQLASIPGLTEEFLKSYNNLNSLNGEAVSKLLADISQLNNLEWSHQSRYDSLKSAVAKAEEKYGEDYAGRISTIGFKGSIEAARKELDRLEQDYQEFIEPIKQVQEILNTSALQDLAKTNNQLLTSLYGSINNEDLRSLLGGQDVTDSALLETLARGMSSNDKQILTNYVTAFGSQFGSDMAAEVLRGLVQQGTPVYDLRAQESYSNKYIDRNYLNILNRLDTTNAISTLYSAEQQSKLLGQNNEYGKRLNNLVEKGFESIGGEVGFFKSLWNSGEFSGLFNKLTSDASMISMINAEVIDKAANKMDILNQALNTDISNLNSAGLASIMQEIAKGTISQGNITESVINAMSAAGYGDSTRVEALENIAELSDYSDSSISIIEKAFANQGKAFTNSFYQNQFWDQPIQEVLKQLPSGIESTYRQKLIEAQQRGESSKDFARRIKTEMPDFYNYITKVGSKKGDITDVFKLWGASGLYKPSQIEEGILAGQTMNNLMTYNESTGFFGFNPEALWYIDKNGNKKQTDEQINLEQALIAQLESMDNIDLNNMLDIDFNGNRHINTNIDTEQQARNLMLAEARINPMWAGKSDEEIIQQYIDPAVIYMREQGGMGALWDSGEAIEGVKQLQEDGKSTSAEAVRAFFNQYGSKILDENGKQMFAPGDKGYEDFLSKYFPDADTTLSKLRQGIFATDDYKNGVTQEQFATAAGNGLTFDDWLKSQSDIYNEENGTINYDAAMEAMRQSGWFKDDAQITSLLKDYGNTQLETGENGQRITATIRDIYGRQQQIALGEGKYQTFDDFQKAIKDSANITDADIQANNAQRSQMDSILINQAMQAGDQGKAASILMGLSDQGRAVFGQYASYLGLGEAWKTAETRSSAQYQQSSIMKNMQQGNYTIDEHGQLTSVEIDGVSVSAEKLDRIAKAVQNIDGTTEAALELQNALNDLVGENETNPLTGTKGEVTVDDDGTIRDSEGNIIEFDENGNPVNNAGATTGAVGGGESGNVPEGGNTGQDNRSPWQVVNDALKNGDVKDGDRFVVDGVAYNATTNDDGVLEIKDDNGNEPPTSVLRASGQNNNIIPQFASGLNESTIATTGELGPELRVRADGSMDLLGKHGREYNWIEPTDKIYTAAQTASILGDKKIREMTAFATGLNNFIPGFATGLIGTSFGTPVGSLGAPTGGSGDGGGGPTSFGPTEAGDELENHRYDPNWMKYRDILERYYTILQQMEDLANALARVAELADRAWGRQRQEAIEETIKLQEQQIQAQKRYLSEINTYLIEDRENMTSMIDEFVHDWNQLYPNNPLTFSGAQFDQNGVLLNYRELTQAMVDAWNMSQSGSPYARDWYAIKGGSSLSLSSSSGIYKPSSTGFATGLGNFDFNSILSGMRNMIGLSDDATSADKYVNLDPQTKLEEQMKDIQFYTDTLNLLQQQETVLQQMKEQLFDTRLQKIQIELQFKMTLKDNELALLDYELSQVKNDAYSAAEAISLISEQQLDTMSRLEDYTDSIRKIFNVNANGFEDYDNWIVKFSDDTNQLSKDLKEAEEIHKKFYDEANQKYQEKYKIDEQGNIIFPEQEGTDTTDWWSSLLFNDPFTSTEGEEHDISEYSKRIMKLYEKYYNIYSTYLPNPDQFLEYIGNEKEETNGILTLFPSLIDTTSGEIEQSEEDARKAKQDIANADIALKQLQALAAQLDTRSIYVDIDKFTQEFKNVNDVRKQLQDIYNDLSKNFSGLKEDIQKAGSNLITESGQIQIQSYADVQKILQVLNEYQNTRVTDNKMEQFLTNPEGFFSWLSNKNENFGFEGFTSQEIETLKADMQQFLSFASQLKGNLFSQIDLLGTSVKTYFKNIETEFSQFDNYKNLFNSWQNILDLTGRSVTKLGHEIMIAFNTKVIDNSIRKLQSSKSILDVAQKQQIELQREYSEAQVDYEAAVAANADEHTQLNKRQIADELKDQLDKTNKELQEALDTYMGSWKDALEGIQAAFQAVVKDSALVFEESFSPFYQSLDMLSTAINREQQLKDLYLTSYQQAHDLSKLNRDIQQSIMDTDNLHGKQELKKILKEVNDLQANGTKLSAYDLDLVQKKYDLELARQALEDAKNAKSLVRLSRDNNGNWGYVYTANEDDVDEAEQNYEDAILAMEQTNEDYLKNLQEQLVQVWTSAEQEIAGLNTDDPLYSQHVQEITDEAMQRIAWIKEQFENAVGGNEYLENNVTGKAKEILQGLTMGFNDTILSGKTGINDLEGIITTSMDNINKFAQDTLAAYDLYIIQLKQKVQEAAGEKTTDIGQSFQSHIIDIDAASDQALSNTTKVLERVAEAFDKMIAKFDEINIDKILSFIVQYEKYGQAMQKFIAAAGDYEAEHTYNLEGGVNDWSKLDKIYSTLMTEGKVWVKYIDENGREVIKSLEAGTEDTAQWLAQQREYIVNLLRGMTAEQREFESQKLLDEYYNNIVKAYSANGALNVNLKGELLKAAIGSDLSQYITNKDELKYDDKGELEAGQAGILQLRRDNAEDTQKILELLKALLNVKVTPVFVGGGGNDYDWYAANMALNYNTDSHFRNTYGDTGLYTGRWQSMDTGGYTGMYTGEWPDGSTRRNGRLAWLHQKELVLNAHDTENFLDAMEIVRQLDNLTNWMANGLGDIVTPAKVESSKQEIDQNVTITAEFPNATDRNEIEAAFENLVNLASQYAYRK